MVIVYIKLDSSAKKDLAETISTPAQTRSATRRRTTNRRSINSPGNIQDQLEQVTPALYVRKRARVFGPEGEEEEGTKKKHARMENKIDHLLEELVELKSTVDGKADIDNVQERVASVERSQNEQSLVQEEI